MWRRNEHGRQSVENEMMTEPLVDVNDGGLPCHYRFGPPGQCGRGNQPRQRQDQPGGQVGNLRKPILLLPGNAPRHQCGDHRPAAHQHMKRRSRSQQEPDTRPLTQRHASQPEEHQYVGESLRFYAPHYPLARHVPTVDQHGQ